MFMVAASVVIGSIAVSIAIRTLADAIHDLCEVIRRGGR